MQYIKIGALVFVAGLLIAVKILLGRNKALKEQIEVIEKQLAIKIKQQKVKDEVRDDEPKQVEDAIRPDGRGRADRLNGVLNDPDA